MSDSTIRHIVAIPANVAKTTKSFFQGFSVNVALNYQEIFSKLALFPHDITELFLQPNLYAQSKIVGPDLEIWLIRSDLLTNSGIDYKNQITVIWSTGKTFNDVEKFRSTIKTNSIHITTAKKIGVFHISEAHEEKVILSLIELAKYKINSSEDNDFKEFLNRLIESGPICRNAGKPPLEVAGHNCVEPLLTVLKAYGFRLQTLKGIEPSEKINQHIAETVKAVSIIDNIIEGLDIPPALFKNNAIVYCPSIYAHLYKYDSPLWNGIYRTAKKEERDIIKHLLIRNRGYSNVKIKSNTENPYHGKIAGPLVACRQLELKTFTRLISILAVNQFTPAIRLPNAAMLHHDKLKEISSIIKSPKIKSFSTLSKKVANYSAALKDDIGDTLIKLAFDGRRKILAICDFPIEWISLDATPLMFTHEISKIGSIPGDMFAQRVMCNERLNISIRTISNILIIRSFNKDDLIKEHLSDAMRVFSRKGDLNGLNIRFTDVQSKKQLIDTLNKFEGAIVVFDCHGDHGGNEDHAWLHIGDEKVDVWSLSGCRIPPIVILSACSTHAIDGSHASVANGFIRCGALSVIGTYAPISAGHAGAFVARLLYRLAIFVPIVTKSHPISWREVVSGFFKMSYATDILNGMRAMGLLNDSQYKSAHFAANMLINPLNPNWLSLFLGKLGEETNQGQEELKKILLENFQFVPTMLYSQLGQPENIIIHSNNMEKAT